MWHWTDDKELSPYLDILKARRLHAEQKGQTLSNPPTLFLTDACDWHLHYGLHRQRTGWSFCEWLPHATEAWLVGEFSDWELQEDFRLQKQGEEFVGQFPTKALRVGQQYRLFIRWVGGEGERIPTAARQIARSTRDLSAADVSFNAVVVDDRKQYKWKSHRRPKGGGMPLIYEAHVGMAQEKYGVGTYDEFRLNVLPRIAKEGYDTLQLMGILEHPYYASFGYHVSNFFAPFDLSGSPNSLKHLIDAAHARGMRVIIDLVHSHAATNEVEGLSCFDGTRDLFFHDGEKGTHPAWGSRLFDYSKPQVLRFLLSNCRYWLEEYHLDGFRFDGITSMLYAHHGLNFADWNYPTFFDSTVVDEDAVAYLMLANRLIHEIRPDAITIAEDVSGFPGLAAPVADCGCGFNYRLAMGITDYWFKLGDIRDEDWDMGHLWYELTSHRAEEKTISYVESHDQALVGGQTFAFRLIGDDMYYRMSRQSQSIRVDRGIALHKMARLITYATACGGYLNFMGNEFGHPDWIDFPTERNHWSFQYARRLWSLMDAEDLKFQFLSNFDRQMLTLPQNDSPRLLKIHEQDKVIALQRGELLFVFNFHPTNSYTDYPIPVPKGKIWRLLLDTDEAQFGGFARIEPKQRFFAMESPDGLVIRLYLPARTALVLK